jgi:hypothetical protein
MDFDSLDFFNAFEPTKINKTKSPVVEEKSEPIKEQEVEKVEETKQKPKT